MSWLTALRHLFPVQTVIPNADPEVRNPRKWRLWQVEPTRDCNLRCLMCPWPGLRPRQGESLHMHPAIWKLLTPHLREVQSIDFTGSGEPLLSPNLFQWLQEAKDCGCRTGFLTNGLLLKEKLPQILEADVHSLTVTINALTQRPMAMYHSWGTQNAWLRQIHGYNRLCMNRDLAKEIGVADDDWVRLETETGTVTAQVSVQASMKVGHLRVPHGWWYPEMPGEEPWLHGVWISNINVCTSSDESTCDEALGSWPLRTFQCKVTKVKSYDGQALPTV